MMRRIFTILLFAGLIALGGLAWAYRATQTAPKWYAPVDPGDPSVAALAETVEYRLLEEFQKVRPTEDPWAVRVREEQINAWLATRLPEWSAHDAQFSWPSEVGTPQIKLTEGGIDVALPVQVKQSSQLVVTRLKPEIANGRLQLRVDRVGLGRLSLPGEKAGKVMTMFEKYAPGGVVDDRIAQQLLSALPGAASVDQYVNLMDGRRIELLDIVSTNGSFDLTSRTLPPSTVGAGQ